MRVVLYADSRVQITNLEVTVGNVSYLLADIEAISVPRNWEAEALHWLCRPLVSIHLLLISSIIFFTAYVNPPVWLPLACSTTLLGVCLPLLRWWNMQSNSSRTIQRLQITCRFGNVTLLAAGDREYLYMLADTLRFAISATPGGENTPDTVARRLRTDYLHQQRRDPTRI